MSRFNKFEALKSHPYYKSIIKRLKVSDLNLCLDFIKENAHLDANAWCIKVARLFLDKSDAPKNLTLIQDVLLCCR